MAKIVVLLAAFCVLSGCMSSPQVSDADACVSYGAQPGTQEYFQCRMAKDQQRQANYAMLAGAMISHPTTYVLPMPH